MQKAELKKELREKAIKTGKIPENIFLEIRPRLPWSGIKVIAEDINVPYSTVQNIFQLKRKGMLTTKVKVLMKAIDLLVEEWGEDVLPFIFKEEEDDQVCIN